MRHRSSTTVGRRFRRTRFVFKAVRAWLLYNEVFPTRIRARATSLCTAINYLSNTVVGASFLPLVSGIGLGGTYGLYATLCFAGFLFVDRFVFETKGLRLEDVEGVMAERERKWRDEK